MLLCHCLLSSSHREKCFFFGPEIVYFVVLFVRLNGNKEIEHLLCVGFVCMVARVCYKVVL